MSTAEKHPILNPMNLPRINQTVKNFRRTRKIVGIMGKHGFHQLVSSLGLAKLLPFSKPAIASADQVSGAMEERLCQAFEELGPTFMKLGQMLSGRPDLVTPKVAKAFRRLQSDAVPIPIDLVKEVITEEFDQPPEKLFSSFNEIPIGQASIAQGHEAILNDGTSVVVKVQRPGIQKTIETDISILYFLAKSAEKYVPELRVFSPVRIIDEFASTMKTATDFIEEAHNIDAFEENFKDFPEVVTPEVHWELTSKRVLTMEKLDGIAFNQMDQIRASTLDRGKLCEVGVDAFFVQIFRHGLFHADVHGGNLIAMEGNRVGFIDFGEVGRLGKEAQVSIANILVSLLSNDFYSVAREYLNLGDSKEPIDLKAFSDELERMLAPLCDRKSRKGEFGEILKKAVMVSAKHNLKLPRELILLGKIIMTVEQFVHELDPDFDLLGRGEHYAAELVRHRLNPDALMRDLLWTIRDLRDLSRIIPTQLKYILHRLSTNEFSMNMKVDGFSQSIGEMDRASNRVSFSIVIMGLLIGSSILIYADRGPSYLGISVLGILGLFAAGGLILLVFLSILRSRRF